jgi:hypothetical protein
MTTIPKLSAEDRTLPLPLEGAHVRLVGPVLSCERCGAHRRIALRASSQDAADEIAAFEQKHMGCPRVGEVAR